MCGARLSASAAAGSLTGADTEDGTGCLDAVLAEIDGKRFLAADVCAALTARECTPDLALRLLLRAITCASDAPLTAEQYTRLEAIGAAMQYGERIVDHVKYLVEQA
ncbi:hypothetical protein AB0F36_35575 [Streptomyces sp. NPDC029080]|uniref:hypothetical protein n=1 Tax=Streptomyces sp. NPDC029080 TaxID=3155017 RepID=UPI0033CEBB27